MLNLDQMATFLAVAEQGSFTAAARQIGLTQPAVSLQIKLLEQRLGVRLVERIGRRAQLSPAGLDFLPHARRVLSECTAAEEAMTAYRDGGHGRVRIGSGGTAAIHLLPRAIAAARQQMPGLEIVVRIGNTDEVLRDLEMNTLDLAVVTLPASGRSLEIEPFYTDELLAVAPEGSTFPEGGPDASFLATRAILLYEGGNTRATTDAWFDAAAISCEPKMEFGSVEAIKELVAAGLGWSLLPGMALKAGKAAGLATSPVHPPLTRQLGLALRRDKQLTRGLRQIIKCLRDENG